MKFYEDPQCPICQQFEAAVGEQVQTAIADGKVQVDYHIVSFLDDASENEYSSRAANALYVVAGRRRARRVREVPRPALREPARRGHAPGPTTTS